MKIFILITCKKEKMQKNKLKSINIIIIYIFIELYIINYYRATILLKKNNN